LREEMGRYLLASTGIRNIATRSEEPREMTTVKARPENSSPMNSSCRRKTASGANTLIVVKVEATMAFIISWLPSTAEARSLAPFSR
jgi:hypothetical protein